MHGVIALNCSGRPEAVASSARRHGAYESRASSPAKPRSTRSQSPKGAPSASSAGGRPHGQKARNDQQQPAEKNKHTRAKAATGTCPRACALCASASTLSLGAIPRPQKPVGKIKTNVHPAPMAPPISKQVNFGCRNEDSSSSKDSA